MINIAICDDNITTTGELETMLQEIARKHFIQSETEVFWDGKKLAESVERGACFDIIFLDIEMGKEDGITVARRIREWDKNILIIYVTSHESYMQESFAVRPFRFLVKPVGESKLEKCFLEAYEEVSGNDSYFRYSYQRMNHKIPIRDILYFESNRRKISIVTQKGDFELYGKLNEIEQSLKISKAAFLRVHQSYLVNYKYVEGLGYDFVVMDNGKRISISEDRRKRISEQYCTMEDTFQHDTQDAQGSCVVVAFALEVSTECHVLYLAGGLEGFVFLFKVIHNAARLHFVGVQILFECCDFFFQRCVACLVCGIGDGQILFAEDVFHQDLQIFNQFCFFLIEVLVQIF